MSPSGKRLGLYFRFHTINITGVEVIRFLRHLLRHLRGPVVLLWDGGTTHRRVIVERPVRVAVADGGRVGLQPVGEHDRPALDVGQQQRPQRRCGRVGDDSHPGPAVTLRRPSLDRDGHQRLTGGAPAALARLDSADERLVDLHVAGQQLSARPHHRGSEPVQHRPRGLVGAESEYPLQPERGDAVLLRGQRPRGSQPHGQRCAGVMTEGAGGAGDSPPAVGTSPHRTGHPPAGHASAMRADHSVGPAQPVQVVQARCIIGKPAAQFRVRPWVVQARPWHATILRLGQSDGYPHFD